MTDPIADLGEIVVTGVRRPSGSTGSYGGGGGGNSTGPEQVQVLPEDPNPPPEDRVDPCSEPVTAFEIGADAAAAAATKGMADYAAANFPNESGFNEREYGAFIWQLVDGEFVYGPINHGSHSSEPPDPVTGRRGVQLINTIPAPGAILVGTIHTHPNNSRLPSGSDRETDDRRVLSESQRYRAAQHPEGQQARASNQAKLYITTNDQGEYLDIGDVVITVYNERNRDAAIGGTVGPEVDPEAQPCPPPA